MATGILQWGDEADEARCGLSKECGVTHILPILRRNAVYQENVVLPRCGRMWCYPPLIRTGPRITNVRIEGVGHTVYEAVEEYVPRPNRKRSESPSRLQLPSTLSLVHAEEECPHGHANQCKQVMPRVSDVCVFAAKAEQRAKQGHKDNANK